MVEDEEAEEKEEEEKEEEGEHLLLLPLLLHLGAPEMKMMAPMALHRPETAPSAFSVAASISGRLRPFRRFRRRWCVLLYRCFALDFCFLPFIPS